MSSTRYKTTILDEDVEIEIEFTVTDKGAPPVFDPINGGDPGWAPEFEVDGATIYVNGEEIEAPTWLVRIIADSEAAYEAMRKTLE